MNLGEVLEQLALSGPSPLAADASLVMALSPDLAEVTVPFSSWAELLGAYSAFTALPVTAAVLTRNEEDQIRACLRSLSADADHVLLVDTGSTDRTVSRAREAVPGVEIVESHWRDDFAYHRNLALTRDEQGWTLFVDADETIATSDRGNLRRALRVLDYLAPEAEFVASPTIVDADGRAYTDNHRVLRRGTSFAFRGRIHERPYDHEGMTPPRAYLHVRLDHTGYTPQEMARKDKVRRNGRLLELCREAEPDNPKWLYYLVRDTMDLDSVPADHLRRLYEELASAVDRARTAGAGDYATERLTDTSALLCELALRFGGAEEIQLQAGILDAAGRKVEAAFYTSLMDAGRLLGRLSSLVDGIDAVRTRETPDNRHLMGRLYELQATLALACGRYGDFGPALTAAEERGAGRGLEPDLEQLRLLLAATAGTLGPSTHPGQIS
ncbi:glycosyltransferase [Streptomyces sp. NBC_00454]|uniref:glycosyltransferase n=1 Tax=Streptomyces sp. NBC_00454 TaxID=2975747 RepID=UPI003254769D